MTERRVLLVTVLALFAAGGASLALTESEADRISRALADPERPAGDRAADATRRPADLLDLMDIQAGDHVLDIFASPGYYSELLAQLVGPTGSVTAFDPPQFVQSPAARANWNARLERRGNIGQDLQPLHSAQFPAASFDIALLHLAYHETYWESPRYGLRRMDPQSFVAGLFQALRPGGRAIVVDHVAAPGTEPRRSVDRLHRIARQAVEEDFLRAGFALVRRSPIYANRHDDHRLSVFDAKIRGRTDRMVLIFRKPEGSPERAR